MEWLIIGVLATIVIILLLQKRADKANSNSVVEARAQELLLQGQLKETSVELLNLQEELGLEREKNRELLSQKKSSETRLGQISEHVIPFLDGCPYNPKDLHFLGNPIDYVVFDLDQGEITFLEVKTGNSKQSKRQKLIKNIIKAGKVYFAEMRIDQKGTKHKRYDNAELASEVSNVDED